MPRRHRQKGALSIREFPPKSDCARAARCLLRRSLGLSISASRTSRSSQRFRPYWGKEAARAAIDGFGRLRLEQIVAMTVPGNVASRRVIERLGMTYDPAEDFEHPRFPHGHPLRNHVLYWFEPLRPTGLPQPLVEKPPVQFGIELKGRAGGDGIEGIGRAAIADAGGVKFEAIGGVAQLDMDVESAGRYSDRVFIVPGRHRYVDACELIYRHTLKDFVPIAPERVGQAHVPDQLTDLQRDSRSP